MIISLRCDLPLTLIYPWITSIHYPQPTLYKYILLLLFSFVILHLWGGGMEGVCNFGSFFSPFFSSPFLNFLQGRDNKV